VTCLGGVKRAEGVSVLGWAALCNLVDDEEERELRRGGVGAGVGSAVQVIRLGGQVEEGRGGALLSASFLKSGRHRYA
jgi:hypothetical protein